jgi:hypothetical protein
MKAKSMSEQRPERRRSPRVPIEITVEYKSGSTRQVGKTKDAGLEGFFLVSDSLLSVGSSVQFKLIADELNGSLDVVGRVVRVAEAVGQARGMGIEIKRIGPGQDAQFERYRHMIESRLYT